MFPTSRTLENGLSYRRPFPSVSTATSSWYAPCKMTLDLSLALLLLAVLGPLILILMALVKLTSRGPALYQQVRLGLEGRPYTIIKIRTMVQDCEQLSGPQWSKAGDPRITRLGRFLRRCHLDELPQLWNVIRGEMSLVGPRPERPVFIDQLEKQIPNYHDRLQVRPGITGLAQIQLPADSDLEGVRRKVAYDLCYLQRMGLWLDLRILVGTILKSAGVPFDLTRRLLWLPCALAEEIDRLSPDESDRDQDEERGRHVEPERTPHLQTI
ncbi:Sugar transferase involved in LPS biosynthesis (colanic, teichoic acid) [Singulisphaera sp. GP187]|uniref:sugar transferase n=1 Tax=Singulisphaera sp. GP187 TaxID=1882752 RepID=UPI00092664CC|nr:sugar transferase [Singulisphaera sp. GP187]SIN67741.1 Sugar transferase involved in LPS biosynthesis (colanic, teichoic acid) [Singulisphaera sp. GP187]